MNRREFLRRTLAVAAALGLPGGVVAMTPNLITESEYRTFTICCGLPMPTEELEDKTE